VFGFLLAAGCQSTSPQPKDNGVDPLLGPDAPKQVAPSAPGGPEARLNGPLPLTQQTSSTAAMAGGGPLKGGRDMLGIPVNDGGSGKKAWQENDGGKTVLKQPLPIAQGQTQGLAPVPNVPSGISPDLQKSLEARHVVYQHQEPVAGGVRFNCIVESQNTLREYTVEAADVEAAVRAVLAKIDQKG
jgi:hypothetical protein